MTSIMTRKIRELPLKEMDGSLLSFAILHELGVENIPNRNKIEESIRFAAYVHRHDIRQGRGTSKSDNYINHPLRNTLRIIRYGCLDNEIITASILHDTVEDHPLEIVETFTNVKNANKMSEKELQEHALVFIEHTYGARVAKIVRKVSNEPLPKTLTKEEKRAIYVAHVIEAIQDDPDVFMVKYADFEDNAIGLYHNRENPGMTQHLSRKYLPLFNVFREGIHTLDLPVPTSARFTMLKKLDLGESRLNEMLV